MNNLRHRLRFKINSGVACEMELLINCAQVWNVHELWHITAGVRSSLRMTRTAPVDPLSHSVGSRVKPLFVAWTISMDSIVPAIFATGAECVK